MAAYGENPMATVKRWEPRLTSNGALLLSYGIRLLLCHAPSRRAGGGRTTASPDDAQVEPCEVAVGRRAIAFVRRLTIGSPRTR